MSIKKKQDWENSIFFCTLTCHNWLPLFEITNFYPSIYRWFDILKTKKIKIIGYVIMPNHLHILLYLPNAAGSIDKIIGNGKRFMAYEIVKILKTKKKFELLYKLEKAVPMKERKIGKLHHVFEPSFDSKVIMTRKFLTQKLNYIHFNPVAKKWNLVEDYRLYKHSSAGFYEVEDYKGYKITHYLEIYS